jgi:hypothetical protein
MAVRNREIASARLRGEVGELAPGDPVYLANAGAADDVVRLLGEQPPPRLAHVFGRDTGARGDARARCLSGQQSPLGPAVQYLRAALPGVRAAEPLHVLLTSPYRQRPVPGRPLGPAK